MESYNFVIIIILIIGIIIVTRELTIRTFQCMKCPIPKYTMEEQPTDIKGKFGKMFVDASPWIGIPQTEYVAKKEIIETD